MQCVSIDILHFLVAVMIPHSSLERHKTIVSFGSDLIIFHNENVTYSEIQETALSVDSYLFLHLLLGDALSMGQSYISGHLLEKEMATHSSVLAWRIPGTGEPGGLPSMASHRVGHD